MVEDRFLKRLRKKGRKGLRGWPIGTVAFYGPNLSQACGCDCILLLCVGFLSEISQRGAGDEVALYIEIIGGRRHGC
jgi:hypothetical protein